MSFIDISALLAAPPSEAISPEKRRELDAAVFLMEQKIHTLQQKAANAGAGEEVDPRADAKVWKQIQTEAIGLLEDALDLRVAVLLAQALLHSGGYEGFNEGLLLIQGLLSSQWDGLIPEEDKADREDPFLERLNLLENLREWESAIKPLLTATLCESPEVGRFSLRDVRIATGKKVEMLILTEAEKKQPPQWAAVQAACKKMSAEELTDCKATTHSLRDCIVNIEAALTPQVGQDKVPDFSPLKEVIAEADDFYDNQLSLRGPSGMFSTLKQSLSAKRRKTATDEASIDAASERSEPAPRETAPQAGGMSMDTINSRQDVIRLLDLICGFYAQNEPSSPVPLLLQRARKLVEKDFYAIMEDLAPKAATELKNLIGEPGAGE